MKNKILQKVEEMADTELELIRASSFTRGTACNRWELYELAVSNYQTVKKELYTIAEEANVLETDKICGFVLYLIEAERSALRARGCKSSEYEEIVNRYQNAKRKLFSFISKESYAASFRIIVERLPI